MDKQLIEDAILVIEMLLQTKELNLGGMDSNTIYAIDKAEELYKRLTDEA